jgi:hypothetical protein
MLLVVWGLLISACAPVRSGDTARVGGLARSLDCDFFVVCYTTDAGGIACLTSNVVAQWCAARGLP